MNSFFLRCHYMVITWVIHGNSCLKEKKEAVGQLCMICCFTETNSFHRYLFCKEKWWKNRVVEILVLDA